MAPALVGTPGTPVYSAASVLNPTTLTPDTGSGYAVGDVILCFTACRVKAPTVAVSGWQELVNVVGSSLFRLALYAKVAASTSEAAPSVVWSGLTTGAAGDPVCAMCQAVTGLDNTNLATLVDLASAATQGGNSTTVAQGAGAITTTINNDLVLTLSARTDDIANTWDALTTYGFTNVTGGAGAGASMLTTSGADMAAQWAYKVKTPAGSSAAHFFTISGGSIVSAPSAGVQVALKATPVSVPLAGTIAGSSGFTGDLTDTAASAGTIASSSTLTGALLVSHPVAGTIAATSSLSGDADVVGHIDLVGTIAATSTLTGALTARAALLSIVAGHSTLTGAVTAGPSLAGSVAGQSTVAADLSVVVEDANWLEGWIDARVLLEGSLSAFAVPTRYAIHWFWEPGNHSEMPDPPETCPGCGSPVVVMKGDCEVYTRHYQAGGVDADGVAVEDDCPYIATINASNYAQPLAADIAAGYVLTEPVP